MATYLPPVERPESLFIELVYAFARRLFGKVPRSTRVCTARTPAPFISFYGRVPGVHRSCDP
jgi:hypothetical protein